MKPSKAVMAGAAVAGLLTGSFAVRAYAASVSGVAGSCLHNLVDLEKGQHVAKVRTIVKDRAVAIPVITAAKARADARLPKAAARAKTAAPPAEASRDWAIYRGLGLAQAFLRPYRAGSVYHPFPEASRQALIFQPFQGKDVVRQTVRPSLCKVFTPHPDETF